MNTTLSTKEKMLLEDQKSHEQMCIEKYTNYANLATDPQLKSLFNSHAQVEREHLNTINQILSGQIPNLPQQQPQQQQNQYNFNSRPPMDSVKEEALDKFLCSDLLMTEKYISDTYDTAIFEFRNPQIREVLNHIQKEEQEHGEAIYKYMESQGMYKVQ